MLVIFDININKVSVGAFHFIKESVALKPAVLDSKKSTLIYLALGNDFTAFTKLSGFIQYLFFCSYMLSVFIIKHISCGNLLHRFIKQLSLRKDKMDMIVGLAFVVVQGSDTLHAITLLEVFSKKFQQLGEVPGFLGKTSDVRMAQYESETRVPKHDLVKEMADIFDISTHALTVPDIDTYIGLMHTFFTLEDMYGLKIDEMDSEVVLRLDKSDYSTYSSMNKMLRAWLAEAKKLENGESTKEEYDDWRYKYPELDTHQIWAKVPSREISDMLLAGLKEMEKESESVPSPAGDQSIFS